jgi:hypothetical protein
MKRSFHYCFYSNEYLKSVDAKMNQRKANDLNQPREVW